MMEKTDVSRWRPGKLSIDAGCLSGSGADEMPSFEFFLSNPKVKVKYVTKNHQHVLCSCIHV